MVAGNMPLIKKDQKGPKKIKNSLKSAGRLPILSAGHPPVRAFSMLLRLGRDLRMPFLLGKNGAIPFAPGNIYIENALVQHGC